MITIPKGNKNAYKNSHFGKDLVPSGSGKNTAALKQIVPIFSNTEQFPPFNPRKATPEEFKARITLYFNYCMDNDIKPGVEAMCLALGTTRKSFFAWSAGIERTELQPVMKQAKQVLAAYMEHISLAGQINPATAIFLLKNWFDYKDNTVTEIEVKTSPFGESMTNEQIEAMIED